MTAWSGVTLWRKAALHAPLEPEVSALIAAHLAALGTLERMNRRKWVDLEYVCKHCGDPVAQVVSTDPRRVLVFTTRKEPNWQTVEQAWRGSDRAIGRVEEEFIEDERRRGDVVFCPLPADVDVDAALLEQPWHSAVPFAMCRCAVHDLSLRAVLDDLRAGTTKRVLRKETEGHV